MLVRERSSRGYLVLPLPHRHSSILDFRMFSLLIPIVVLPLGFMVNLWAWVPVGWSRLWYPWSGLVTRAPFFGVQDPLRPRRDDPRPQKSWETNRQVTHSIYVHENLFFIFSRLATTPIQDPATSPKLVLLLYWLGRSQFQSTPGQPAPEKPVWSTLRPSQSTLESL